MSNKTPGQLFVIAAPSGAGKSTLVNAMLAQDQDLSLSISHTTRPQRPGERDQEHYHFVTEVEFKAAIEAGEFLEHAQVFDHWYGTSRSAVAAALTEGRDVILEIDWQGAQQVSEQFPDSCLIFILPPSVEALRQRLEQRGQDSAQVIARRMADAGREMAHHHEFDYLVINEDFDSALEDLLSIVRSRRLKTQRQQLQRGKLLEQLLECK